MRTKVAILDFDGTLYAGGSAFALLRYAIRFGRHPWRTWWMIATFLPLLLLATSRVLDRQWLEVRFMQSFTRTLAGLSRKELEAMFSWILEDVITPGLRTDMMSRLQMHVREGDHVILLSGVYQPLLDQAARLVGAHMAIGTPLEMHEDTCTGHLKGPPCVGTSKVERLRQCLASQGIDVDWAGSHAYGDSFADLSFLELVGHPIAVYPKRQLRSVALGRGWAVIEG